MTGEKKRFLRSFEMTGKKESARTILGQSGGRKKEEKKHDSNFNIYINII